MRAFLRACIFFLVALQITGCGGGGGGGEPAPGPFEYSYRMPVLLDDGWAVDTLASEGLDEGRLSQMMNVIYSENHDAFLRNIVIAKNGKLLFEEYFGDRDVNGLSHLQSATKSVVSGVFGIAVTNGYVGSIDDSLFQYFPEYAHLNNADKDQIEIRHVLTMTPGFDWNEASAATFGEQNDNIAAYRSENYIRYVLQKDVVTTPGAAWNYNSGCPMLMAGIIKNQAGIHIDEFADLHLFGPLGVTNLRWEYQSDGLPLATGGLWLRARDSAKFGHVFLDRGRWQGQQVIAAEWVEASLTEHVAIDTRDYGFLWWTERRGGHRIWYAAGYGGQRIILVPERATVIVINASYTRDTAETGQRQAVVQRLLDGYIFPAI